MKIRFLLLPILLVLTLGGLSACGDHQQPAEQEKAASDTGGAKEESAMPKSGE